ncbi:unnamed protein product [Arabidopsis arenosa]|uniref:DUF1985 domain-containing protein n=1 Tax=Arabidopsis arenosa TaxID=38785 RepID=A0A8S2APK3_ARAAE|nr:unnamed protein product [Arabidopsis arenosa]
MANPLLPMRLFREGAEPNGERVQSYSELPFIDEIANSLDAEDLQFLRDSQFGKLFEIPEGPAYSGKLIHFLLSRQLVVNKENEIWVVFAGSPLRFSISEFQRMTGLNCNKPPQSKARKSKRKLLPGKYWYTLFDRADVSVEWVVGRLKKRLVPDKEIRLRYAMLALIDGVLCPTSGKPKISPTHADMSENLEKFLNHPWGTTSFQLTLKSIKARGAEKLKRKSVTVQGFPHALQLLLLHSVPIIKELQFPDPDLEADGDSEMEEIDTEIERLWSLKLDIVWKVDKKLTTNVVSILSGEVNGDPLGSASWVEDRDDAAVDQMIQLIGRRDKFTASMFGGGLLPDSLPDDKNDNSDVCSTHDSLDEVNGPKRKRKGKANVQISEAMKQYVDMKDKQSENRMLKAISESEGRLTKLIMEAISSFRWVPSITMTRLMLANPSREAANAMNRYAGNREKGLSVDPVAPSVASSMIGNSIPTWPID